MIFLQTGRHQVGFGESCKKDSIDRNLSFFFISKSPVMKKIHEKIKGLALSQAPVLILGARGTGRTATALELFNGSEHNGSKQFIKLVCYGLCQDTIEKQLFGENNEGRGLLQGGSGKTLFIKGIECFSLPLQKRFLSCLMDSQKGKVLPRFILSSSDKLSEKIHSAQFCQDLFKILSKNLLILPSLSERSEDIPFLVSLFNSQNGFKGYMTDGALKALKFYCWEENIKQLKNICLQLSILYPDKEFITEEDVSAISQKNVSIKTTIRYNPNLSLEDIVNYYIQMSLDHFKSKQKSAKALGISVKTIYNKIKTGHVVFSGCE